MSIPITIDVLTPEERKLYNQFFQDHKYGRKPSYESRQVVKMYKRELYMRKKIRELVTKLPSTVTEAPILVTGSVSNAS
jgi:hypothetical protein